MQGIDSVQDVTVAECYTVDILQIQLGNVRVFANTFNALNALSHCNGISNGEDARRPLRPRGLI